MLGAGIVGRQVRIVQGSHGEDDEQQRELLQVHPFSQWLAGVLVHLVEDRLDALPGGDVVTGGLARRYTKSLLSMWGTHFQA